MSRPVLTEMDFQEFTRCPLRSGGPAAPHYGDPVLLDVASATAKWLVSLTFTEKIPSLAEVREHFEKTWKAKVRDDVVKSEYRRGLKAIPGMSKRLHDMAAKYTVLHPVTVYNVSFGRNAVRGEYATLANRRQLDRPLLLRLRIGCDADEESQQRGPDTINMLRWLHFRQWEASLPLARVLNWSLDSEESWLEFYNEVTVRKYLQAAAANLADQRFYPIPGMHCESCKVRVCVMEAIDAFPARNSRR